MKKWELIEGLKEWPDETEVEIAIPMNPRADNLKNEDRIWFEIAEVERHRAFKGVSLEQCLIFADKIIME